MEKHDFLISVIIPTCHRNDLLSACLKRLAPGMQNFSFDRYEVIVSDDGFKSTARAMMENEFPWAQWVEGPRIGPAANRNNGVAHCQGEWIAFTDDDCLPTSEWLAAFAENIEANALVLEGKTTTGPSQGLFFIAPGNLNGGYLWSCNMMIQKKLFNEVGGFDEKLPYPNLEDVDLRLRLEAAGHHARWVPDAVVFHPLRALRAIRSQALFHESDWYMSYKHKMPLSCFQMQPYLFWKSQLRQIIKNARNPFEALQFFLTRSCVEAYLLLIYAPRWNRKYKA